MSTQSSIVNVYMEETPNPATMKFITTRMLMNGSVDFPSPESAQKSPFARDLFGFSFVNGVFIASNFVTITKPEGIEWYEIQPILREHIKAALESNQQLLPDDHTHTNTEFTGTESEQKIQQILQDYVQPAVEQDGGAIHFKSFEEGKVTVMLKGSCSGCPSSTITLKSGIENLLKRMVPEVTEVVAEAM